MGKYRDERSAGFAKQANPIWLKTSLELNIKEAECSGEVLYVFAPSSCACSWLLILSGFFFSSC